MTDYALWQIYQEAGSPKKALRAIFEAGRQAERDGEDEIFNAEATDTLLGLEGNYETRATI